MKIELVENVKGQWFWHIIAANKRILAHSQSYSSKQACKKTARSVGLKLIFGRISEKPYVQKSTDTSLI